MRRANKAEDIAALTTAQDAWLDFYVKGTGSQPFQGATAFAHDLPDLDALRAARSRLAAGRACEKGVVRFRDSGTKTISAGGGSASVDTTFDPVSGDGACATASGSDLPGVATYRLPAAAGSGYTLMGSPTVLATINSPVANSELAAGCSMLRPTVLRPSLTASSTGRRSGPRGRSSSSIRPVTCSPRATSPSSSCSRRTQAAAR